MLNFICKTLPHSRRNAFRSSAYHKLHFLQLSMLSSSSKKANKGSFMVSYLINTCGFPPKNAIVSARYLDSIRKPEQPDRVISFLKNQGFSDGEVFKLIRKKPLLLALSPDRNLQPKIEFLRSLPFSQADLSLILVRSAERSLKNQIIPSFEFLKNLIGTKEKTVSVIRRCPKLLVALGVLVPNVDTLRRAGVPEENIGSYLRMYPGKILQRPERYKKIVDSIREMGMNPQQMMFIIGVMVLSGLHKVTFERKMEAYKRWGYSEEEVLASFKAYPWCMMVSMKKIEGVLNYLVNEMGWDAPILTKSPSVFTYSLEKRIIPRYSVYQVLVSKGLIRELSSLPTILKYKETKFLAKFVELYEKEAPELLELYQEKQKPPS